MRPRILSLVAGIWLAGAAVPVYAQGLKDQVVGTWNLTAVVEDYSGVKKDSWGPGVQGRLHFDAGGRFALQIAAANREKKGAVNPAQNPVGQVVAYFGTYIISDADKTLTFKIDRATFPNWDGTEQKRVFTLAGDKLEYRGAAPIPSADGPFIPIIEWARAK